MKKIFSFLTAILFATSLWGAENDTHDFAQSISQSMNDCATFDDIEIAEQSYPIKSVIITYAYNKTINPQATVTIGSTEVGTQNFASTGNLTTFQTLTFTPESPIKGAVTISNIAPSSCSGYGKGTLKVTNVRLVEGADAGGDVIVKTLKSIAVTGMTTTFDQFSAFSFDGTCNATYSVTKNDVPQDDEVKAVTPTSISSPDMTTTGVKAVTVTYVENEVEKSTTYDITVNAHTVTPDTYDITPNNTFWGKSSQDGSQNVSANAINITKVQNDITLVLKNNTSTSSYFNSTSCRVYNGYTLTISVPAGYVLTAIEFTGSTWVTPTASVGTISSKSWEGEDNSVTFTFSGTSYMSNISVTYAAEAKVAKPNITGQTPFFTTSTITLTCSTDGATIYYTTNGNVPTSSSTLYEAPFTIDATSTVKAIAIKGEDASAINEKTFTKEDVLTIAEAMDVIDEGTDLTNRYVVGYIYRVESFSSTYKSITYWLTADNTDTLEVYSGKNFDGNDFSNIKSLSVGDEVVVYGTLKKFGDIYEFDKNSQLVERTAATLNTVTISGSASHTAYEAGDDFDFAGLIATANYSTSYTKDVTEEENVWTADPATISEAGDVSVTATFGGKTSDATIVAVTVNTHAVTIGAHTNGTLFISEDLVNPIESGNEFVKGIELLVEATPINADYKAGVVTVTKTIGGDDVTANVLENGVITMPAYPITVSATFEEKAAAGLAWSAAADTAYTVGQAYTLQTLTNPNSLSVTYSSSDATVATISNEAGHEGEIISHKTGTTTIKAKFAGDETYKADSVSYTLNVYAPTSVVITGEATKTAYEYGEDFSLDGLGAKAVYGDATEYEIPSNDLGLIWDVTVGSPIVANGTVSVTAQWDGLTSAVKEIDVTVNTHTVSFEQPENGTLAVQNAGVAITSGDAFVKGTVLTVVATPDAKYEIDAITVNGETLEAVEEVYSFTVGTSNITVAAAFKSTPTALDNTEEAVKATKVLRDGQIFILRDEKTYTVQGQLVK